MLKQNTMSDSSPIEFFSVKDGLNSTALRRQHIARRKRASSSPSSSKDKSPEEGSTSSQSGTKGSASLLSKNGKVDLDLAYCREEEALSEFLSLHPMLTLNAVAPATLSALVDLLGATAIPVAELPVVSKTHDDLFLGPANPKLGERACVCEDRCIARWLAIWRYGPNSVNEFVCKEYLLPKELHKVRSGESLVRGQGKCLLCIRYYQTYIFKLAQIDPNISNSKIGVQSFSNTILPPYDGRCLSSAFYSEDGYRPCAMLGVEKSWLESREAATHMSSFAWRPVVRFCASHYQHILKPDRTPCIMQVGIGIADKHFRQPA